MRRHLILQQQQQQQQNCSFFVCMPRSLSLSLSLPHSRSALGVCTGIVGSNGFQWHSTKRTKFHILYHVILYTPFENMCTHIYSLAIFFCVSQFYYCECDVGWLVGAVAFAAAVDITATQRCCCCCRISEYGVWCVWCFFFALSLTHTRSSSLVSSLTFMPVILNKQPYTL